MPPTRDINLSVIKAAQILRCLSGGSREWLLQEVVKTVGLPKTVCHRLLATLEAERFVDRDPDSGKYRLGTGLLTLAGSAQSWFSIRASASQLLAALAQETRDAAILLVADRNEALCIDRFDGDYPVRVEGMEVGRRLPLNSGGGPLALLSFSPREIIEAVLARPLPARTQQTITDPVKLRARIQEVQRAGYAVGEEDAFEHLVAVGAPIFGSERRLMGAISLGGIKPRYDGPRISALAKKIVSVANAISDKLGQ